jgi:hypothetical protein
MSIYKNTFKKLIILWAKYKNPPGVKGEPNLFDHKNYSLMKPLFRFLVPVLIFSFVLYACSKENSSSNNNGDCNNTVMRFQRIQATFDDSDYIAATWNGDGTMNTLRINVPLSFYRNAKFIYEGGRVSKVVLYTNTGDFIDTVICRYNAEGKVDSMHLKNDDHFAYRLSYTSGKISTVTRIDGSDGIQYYFNVTTDDNGNIIKSDEYDKDAATYTKESTYTWKRDTRKNPLADVAPFLLYLNDEYEAFWYWGPNNDIEQRYQDFTGTGIDIITGHKFVYNNNCYPESYQNTIMGQVIVEGPDFIYTYY